MTRKIFEFIEDKQVDKKIDSNFVYSENLNKVFKALNSGQNKKILVVGKVQSGKTGNMIELCRKLLTDPDSGFTNVIVLTGTRTNLNQQTFERFKTYFTNININVYNFDGVTHTQDNSNEKNIYISLKNSSKLKKLIKLLKTERRNGKTLIIDDEADHASLNTHNRKDNGKISATNKNVISLLECKENNFYIGYTATPQGFLLGGETNGLKPDVYVHISPYAGYFGVSDFIDNIDKYSIEIDDIDPFSQAGYASASLREAIFYFLDKVKKLGDADIFDLNYGINMVVHNSSRKDNHSLLEKTINEIVEEFNKSNDSKIDVEPLVLNSDTSNNNIFYDHTTKSKNYIIIGGELLSRGFTIPNLIVFYSSKQVKENNVDTIYQRMRFCGYREKYSEHIRIYIPYDMLEFYFDVAANEKLILDLIGKSETQVDLKPVFDGNKIWFFSSKKNLFPTRKGVIYKNVIINSANGNNIVYCRNDENQFSSNRAKIIDKLNIHSTTRRSGKYTLVEKTLDDILKLFDILDIESSIHNTIINILNTIKYYLDSYIGNNPIKVSLLISDSLLDEKYIPGTNYRTVNNNYFPFIGDSERKSMTDFGIKDDVVIFINRLTLKYENNTSYENLVVDIKIPESRELTYYEI
jgi:hypothetical protein